MARFHRSDGVLDLARTWGRREGVYEAAWGVYLEERKGLCCVCFAGGLLTSGQEGETARPKTLVQVGMDQVYYLLGIFEVYLPLIHEEGKQQAFRRLQDEIDRCSVDTKSDRQREYMGTLRTLDFS
jgi:hypothetical protein